jgi:hypothetical protein
MVAEREAFSATTVGKNQNSSSERLDLNQSEADNLTAIIISLARRRGRQHCGYDSSFGD